MKRTIVTVKGHCATWRIYEDGFGFYEVCGKKYSTLSAAHRAIRIAEQRYLEANPKATLVNSDIWATHGVLWCDDFDGNYYA